MKKRIYWLRKIIVTAGISAALCVGCGQRSAQMPPEASLQEEAPEEIQETEEMQETEEKPEDVTEIETMPESESAASDEEQTEKEEESSEKVAPSWLSAPKPWGELAEGSAPVISFTDEEREWYTKDGKYVLYEVHQNILTVENEGFENLQKALTEYFPPIEETEHESRLQSAQEAYENYEEKKGNYFYEHYCWEEVRLMRSDSTVISFEEYNSMRTGDMNPKWGCTGATFDTATGRKLELADILRDEEGFYKTAVDYITSWLSENFGQSFNQRRKKYVDGTFSGERTVNWYLNGSGVVVIYNPYEVANYTAVKITLPYGIFYDYIKEEYTNPHRELIADVPGDEDIAGLLGEESKIVVETEGDSYENGIQIVTDHSKELMGYFAYLRNAYLIKRQDGRSFLLLVGDYASDDNVLFVYEVTGGIIKKCDELSGADLSKNGIRTDKVGVNLVFYELGTYTSAVEYTLSEDGKLIRPEEIFPIESDWRLTVIKELPVIIDGAQTVVGVGSQIVVTGTNNKDTIYFKVADSGQQGEIHYEMDTEETWIHLVDGVSEYDYFEGMPYAG